jgi:PIN domain nuclease of toxin-antitoxin system
MLEIFLVLIKGFIISVVTFFVIGYLKKSTYKIKKGDLKYTFSYFVIALLNLTFTILLWWVFLTKNYKEELSQTISLVALIIFFSASSIYLLAEGLFAKGRFDDEKIYYQTIWSGKKEQRWQDLISITPKDTLFWYEFKFRDDSKMRFSYLLGGVEELIKISKEKLA